MRTYKFICPYCDKKYKTPRGMDGHECEIKEKIDTVKTVIGKEAFDYYVLWHNYKRRRTPDIRRFVESSEFKHYITFAKFARKIDIPNTSSYIKLMAKIQLAAVHWTKTHAYSEYLKLLDNREAYIENIENSMETIFDYTDSHEVTADEFFDVIDFNELIKLIVRRKLSPWLLYHSDSFIDYYSALTKDRRRMIETLIPFGEWEVKFNKEPAGVKLAEKVTFELGI